MFIVERSRDAAQLIELKLQKAKTESLVDTLKKYDSAEGKYPFKVKFLDVNESDDVAALLADLEGSFPGVGVSFIDQNHLPSV